MEPQSDCIYWSYGSDNTYANSMNSPIMKIEQDPYRGGADSINPNPTIDIDCDLSYEDPSGLGHHPHHHRHNNILDYNNRTYSDPENYSIHNFKIENNSSSFLSDCEFTNKAHPNFETEGILVNVNHEPISRELNPFRLPVKLEKTINTSYNPPEDMDFPNFDVDVPGGIDSAIPIDLDLDELFRGWGEALNHIFWKVANPIPFHDITGLPKIDDDILRKLRYSLYGPLSATRSSSLSLPALPLVPPPTGNYNYYQDASSLLNELLGEMNPPTDTSYYQSPSPSDGSGSGVTSLSDQSTTTASTLVSSDPNSPTHYHELEPSRIKQWERKCSVCGIIIYGGEQRYDAHVKNAHELTCLCGETFKFKLKLNNHIKNMLVRGNMNHDFTPGEKIKPLFECDFCDEIFHNRNKAFKHREEHLVNLNPNQISRSLFPTKVKPSSRKSESQSQSQIGHTIQLSRQFLGGTGKPPLMSRTIPLPPLGERKRRSSKTPTPSGEVSTKMTERSTKYRKKAPTETPHSYSKDIRKKNQPVKSEATSRFSPSAPANRTSSCSVSIPPLPIPDKINQGVSVISTIYTPMTVPVPSAMVNTNDYSKPAPNFRPVRATLVRQSATATQLSSFPSVIPHAGSILVSQPNTGMGTGKGKRLDISKSATEKKVENSGVYIITNATSS